MRNGIRVAVGSLAMMMIVGTPLVASAWNPLAWNPLAWKQSAMINVRVHDHTFHRVAIAANECSIQTQLYFTAPEEGYSSGSASRNYHRFKARVRLTEGKFVESPVFGNPKAGRRYYAFSYDTSSEGCWAKEQHKLQKLDVEACRGRGCEPEPFK